MVRPTSDDPRSASFARIAVLIPVRWLEGAKSRLGGTLDPEERQELVKGLLRQTIRAASTTPNVTWVGVVSPDPAVLDVATTAGAEPILQQTRGLNPGLTEGRVRAIRTDATAVLILPADLPAVSSEELAHLIGEARGVAMAGHPLVALVPDRHRRGTNLLLLSPPAIIPFAFGPDSRKAHTALARNAGAMVLELEGPLSVDLDTPEDMLLVEPGVLDLARGG